jgi:TorA maturation chaperone TorD
MSDVVTAVARAALYGLLSAVFGAPPSAGLLTNLAAALPADLLAESGLGAANNADDRPTGDELAVAFTRLMVGPGKGYVPPYGSVYLDPSATGSRPQLWGPSTAAALELYRAAGLEPAAGQIPDHLALELKFMQFLCEREAAAARQDDQAAVARWRRRQADFLHDHLGRWAPAWAAAAGPAAGHPFYATMVRVLVQFLEDEQTEYQTRTDSKE